MNIVTPPGRPAEDWRPLINRAPSVPVSELPGYPGTLVVLAAHPDDETIGAGRLIAQWAAQCPVAVVCLTAGEACLDHLGVQVPGLAGQRRRELFAATAELGVGRVRCLDLPDGRLADHLPDIVEQTAPLLRRAAAVAVPWRYDPHPDHAALGRALSGSAEHDLPVLEYPIWSSYWQPPDTVAEHRCRLLRVATGAEAEAARARALTCYGSQTLPLRSDLTPVVSPAMLEHHREQYLFADVSDADIRALDQS